MAFFESPRFPECLSFGAVGGPGFNTDVVVVSSGFESRNANWSTERNSYEVSYTIKTEEDKKAISSFFRLVRGRANGFRYKDFTDYFCSFADGTAGNGDAMSGPFQLVKKYVSGGVVYQRRITKPVVSKIKVKRGGTDVIIGSGAGQISIDYTKGQFTFTADAVENVTDVTVGSTTQIALANAIGLTTNQFIYLDGFTGGDAVLLNGKTHKINSVTGSGPYVYTLAIDTSGKTITRNSSTNAYKYPQASESFTWEGEFDVPCRFDTDELRAEIVAPGILRWDGIPIVEIRV